MRATGYHEEEALGKAYDGRLMRRLLTYVRPYLWMVVVATILLLVSSALRVSLAFLTQIGIDDYIKTGDESGLGQIALITLGAITLILLGSYGQQFLTSLLGQKVLHDIRMQVFSHIQRLHLGYFDKNPVGRLLTRVTNDVNVLNEMFSAGVVSIIGDIVSLVLIVAALFYYNWQLALITFLVLPLLAGATFLFKVKVRKAYRRVRTRLARVNAFTQEHISGMTVVQLYNQENRTYRRYDDINSGLRRAHHDQIYYYAIFFPVVEIIGALSIGLLLYYGGVRIYEGALTFGALVAFIQLVEQFYRPLRDLSEKYNVLQNSMASSERIFQLLDTKPSIVDPPQPIVPKSFDGRIEFEKVWFAYNDDEWVLRDVSFTVEPGESVAVVGSTGAGKTTLMSLLLRFYDYQKGSLKLDGVDIKQRTIDELRSHLGLVLQDVFLFSGDFASNVRLRKESISDDQVRTALTRVGFDRFLDDQLEGIHQQVKERGATLSTGQKQLLSFARALAYDPEVLILDEATSSVDTETELLIQEALRELLKGRTSIIIAHRLSTIENADKIIVMHHGQVREIGTHAELLKKKGIYHTLYRMQYRQQARNEGATTQV